MIHSWDGALSFLFGWLLSWAASLLAGLCVIVYLTGGRTRKGLLRTSQIAVGGAWVGAVMQQFSWPGDPLGKLLFWLATASVLAASFMRRGTAPPPEVPVPAPLTCASCGSEYPRRSMVGASEGESSLCLRCHVVQKGGS